MNLLEQLVAEWYEYSGYLVRTNVRARKRPQGGWGAELDVLAFLPSKRELVHIEASSDADAWLHRKQRLLKKFILNRSEYEGVIGSPLSTIRKIAIVGWVQKTRSDLGWDEDIEVLLIPNFLSQIVAELRQHDFMRDAIPEKYPILRTMQMMIAFGLAQRLGE